MGTQNKEIKIALDIQAKIDKASNQINTLKKQIDNFELSKGLAGDFAKEFKNIEHELAELQRRTASGEINLIDAKSAEKEIDKIEKRWAFLLSKIGGESFLEKGLKTDAQAMAALESLAQSYAKSIKEAELQESKLNKRLEEAKQHQKELNEAQKEQKVVKASELEDQKAQLALLQQQEKAAKKARDDAEKALRTKVEESGGKYLMDQASQKGSPLRKTDAYRTFRQAQSTYETAKANTKTQKANVGSMVTKEMQVAEATAAKEAIDKATEALENYRKTVLATAKEDAFEKAKESLKSISEFKDINWEGLGIDLTDIKSVEDLEKALAKLRIEADKRTDEAIKEMETSTKEAGQGFQRLKGDVKNAEVSLEELDEQARQTEAFEARIKQFLGMAGAVELLRRALRQAFETTKELDAAMTEMAVVTDLEVGDYWKQLPDHTKRASELGVAIHSVYEAETLYYQQGLKTAEAQELANTTLRMARIAGLDAAEATDKMTAALRGFNMELNEASAEKVADVYSELAAITAADVNEISSAMTKTASIASSAGMEFETTAAFLSQIIETTRESAETAGTAMKTVIARFSEVKKLQGEGLLTGSDEEGEVIDVNKIQTALRSVGISMDGFFAGTEGLDSIFLKLAEKWDTLDVKTQRYIATIAAGSRQQSRFIAMMSDYSRTQELMTAANNSAGASQRQYEKTLESLESKLAKLKNAWDEFSMGILQSDLVKFGVDALTKFLEIINKATNAIDGLGGTVTKLLTTIALFKLGQKIFDGIKTPMANFFTKLVKDVYTEGQKAGKSFAQGVADSQKTEEQLKEEERKKEEEKQKEYLNVKEHKTLKEKTKEAFGISNFNDQEEINENEKANFDKFKQMKSKRSKKDREADYLKNKQKVEELETARGKGQKVSEKEIYKAKDSLKRSEQSLIEYKKTEEEVQEASQKGWNNVSKGFQQMGTTIASVGIGMSMLGGILQSMGLEEFGEGLTQIGNILTIVGGGISAIGTMVPVVAKILAAAGITVQAAWWWVVLIVAAIAAAIALIAVAIKKQNDAKLENRMKAAAEAIEKAKEAAEQAKEAYDDMVADRKGFDDMQKKLASLTKGTKEWREALRESNAQVLEMIQTYPELAQYITKGDQGQLTISDEGWDKMIENQQKAVTNAQSVVMNRQFDELDLKKEGIEAERDKTYDSSRIKAGKALGVAGAVTSSSFGLLGIAGAYGIEQVAKSHTNNEYEKLNADLANYLNIDSENTEEREKAIQEISKKWGMTENEIRQAAREMESASEEMEAIAEQTEAIARANLTAMASQSIQDSEYGDSVVDAFANSLNNKTFNDAVKKQVSEMDKTGNGKGDQKDQEDFKRIAEEYGVSSQMTGKDKDDIKTLYKAVIGTEADNDMSTDEMLKAIVEADQTNKLVDKMDQYLSKLQDIKNIDTRENVAAMLSGDGKGMSRDFAESIVSGGRDEIAKYGKMVFGSMDAWAEATGKSVDELYNEIEKNARDAVTINEATFGRLNRVLKKSGNDIIKKFGTSSKVATENAVKLTDKLVIATQTAGEKGGRALTDSLGKVLDSAVGEADKVASLIGSMNWSDADSWDKLQEELDVLNISVNKTDLETFINQIKDLGIIVHTVDFNKVSEQIQKMNELIKSIDSGEQGRTFSKESYEMLTAANEDLAGSFVQIGDEFHYLGGSMHDLSTSLKEAAILEAKKAELQLQYQKQISDSIFNFDKNGVANGEGKLKLSDGGYDQWTKEEKISYLENFREYAQQNGVETLSYLTDEQGNSLGLSLGTNFEAVTEENLDQYLKALQRFANEKPEFAKEYTEKVSATNVAKNLLLDAPTLVENAQKERLEGNEIAADDYSKALSIQASQSGAVADSIISRYNELVAMDSEDANVEEEMRKLESIMSKGIEKNLAALEKLQQINGYTNEVAAALEAKYQKEIDKLSEVNDSINTANEKLVGKIQEQINQYRQDRDNARKEEEIGKKQSQLAYLLGDTSGASMLQAQALQEQITQDQEAYQDTLIDQGLQKLSDDNAAAAEQRERQIEMMQASLDYNKESGNLTREAENIVISSLREINAGIDPLTTKMYEILYEAEKIDGKVVTQQQQDEFARQFTSEVTPVANALDDIEGKQNDSKGELTSINQLTGDIKTLIDNEKDKSLEEQTNKGLREEAFKKATNAALGAEGKGQLAGKNLQDSSMFSEAYSEYLSAGGTDNKDQFYERVFNKAKKEYDWYGIPSNKVGVAGLNDKENAWFNLQIGDTLDKQVETGKKQTDTDRLNELYKSTVGEEVGTGSVLFDYKDEKLYIYGGSGWYQVLDQGADLDDKKENWSGILTEAALKLKPFKTGGIADFTGPAWLDGTKSHPELVLNARDTENFILLKDILSEIMNHSTINNSNSSKQDTNYIDIDINVDSIASDYDVEQMADKIRSMLYEDATYRNVNSINLLR